MSITEAASPVHATTGRSAPSPPAAATISGEGVSPAAIAAARGSPPGSAAATSDAVAGRFSGSLSRQRRMARSTAGSMSETWLDGVRGVVCSRTRRNSVSVLPENAAFPVKSS